MFWTESRDHYAGVRSPSQIDVYTVVPPFTDRWKIARLHVTKFQRTLVEVAVIKAFKVIDSSALNDKNSSTFIWL